MGTAKYDLEDKQSGEPAARRMCSFRAALVLAGGILMHVAIGNAYTFGNFSPYFISYLRNRTADTWISNVDATWIGSVGTAGNILGMATGGVLDSRLGTRLTLLLGALVFSGSTLLTYFAVKQGFALMVLTYGATLTFGSKIIYGVPMQTVMKWFPANPSFAVGMLLAGYGGGAFVFNPIITGFINPDNLSPDYVHSDGERYFTQPELLDRVPYCFLILGACFLVLLLIGISVMTDPPPEVVTEQVKQVENGADKQIEENPKNTLEDGVTTPSGAIDDLSHLGVLKLALRTRAFYIVGAMVIFHPIGMTVTGIFYKVFGQKFIHDDHFLSLVGSLASVCNCVGRPIWGAVMDKFGFRVAIFGISGGLTVLYSTLHLTEEMPRELYLLWMCLIYLFYCGFWAVVPSTLAKLVGVQHMAISYAVIQICFAVASLSGSTIASTVQPKIGWYNIFYLSSGLAGTVFLLTILFNGKDIQGKRI